MNFVMKILVSACLLGVNCKYNGKNNKNEKVLSLLKKGNILIPVCPEQLGGLTTPRLPAQIQEGSGLDVLEGRTVILDEKGRDVSSYFIRGAYECLYISKIFNINKAIFKEKSPSCGVNYIYNRGNLVKSEGLTSSLLKLHNIKVVSENFKEEDLID